MNTYPGNSHKSKDVKRTAPTDEKKIQKRVSKPAKTKKKGELRKIAEEFIVDDVKNIKTYVIFTFCFLQFINKMINMYKDLTKTQLEDLILNQKMSYEQIGRE